MSNDKVKDFAEVMNRIARVPISAVPKRTTKQSPENKPIVENNRQPSTSAVNKKNSDK